MTAAVRGRAAIVAVVALLAASASCTGSAERSSDAAEGAGGNASAAEVFPARFTAGPTGGAPSVDLRPDSGMVATECSFSHESENDPIVFPGEPGAAHHHNFFGNTTTDAFSTTETLLAGDTTCRAKADTAAYWAPALSRNGTWLQPISSDAYYRVAPGVAATEVQAYPQGLMMIGGDAHATEPQPTEIVAWACDRSRKVSSTPPTCPEGAGLTLRVVYPDCWNGRDLDTEDHRLHVAYSDESGCPESHPVAMPQLTFVVHYPVTGPPDGLGLSPGSLLGGHADFVNTWNQEALEREVENCLRRGLVCKRPGGTGGSPPQF